MPIIWVYLRASAVDIIVLMEPIEETSDVAPAAIEHVGIDHIVVRTSLWPSSSWTLIA